MDFPGGKGVLGLRGACRIALVVMVLKLGVLV